MIRHLRTLSGTIAVLALLAVVGWSLYAPAMNAPFVFDDVAQILDNPFIRFSESSGGIGQLFKSPNPNRTLAYASFALDYYFHGTDVTGYHITNLIIHVLSAFLVFLIYRQTLSLIGVKDRFIGLLTAILWLVNPVHTQSVTYIVQRMNAMAAMFVLLSLVLTSRPGG